MRFESRKAFSEARPIPGSLWDGPLAERLPLEIGFLRRYFIDEADLRSAASVAAATGTCAARTIIADGRVSAALYYQALARHLGRTFVADWPQTEPDLDPAAAHKLERIPLAEDPRGCWLLAPTGDDLRVLLEARRLGMALPDIAITTPAHLSAIIRHRAQDAVEHAASDGLPDMAPHLSAKGAASRSIGVLVGMIAICCVLGIIFAPRLTGDLFCLMFFASICFRLIVCAGGVGAPSQRYRPLNDPDLPFYTVLVPLHREAEIVPVLIDRLRALDYPPAKLEILILVEPEDVMTRNALASIRLPPWFRIVVSPSGTTLRTKPRALNLGLLVARGALLTVYDAEDRPEPDQLRRAAACFNDAPAALACLQARLAMENATGLLPRLFAIEYAALFDLYNIGIVRFRLPLALGGTSNHFRTSALRAVGGWDAWNVTEDADLGLRLARLGYDVASLDSTTFETAPTKIGVWMKQRRRWTKGWMQTFLVLGRDALSLPRDFGWANFGAVCCMSLNLVAGPLLLPFFSGLLFWTLALSGLARPYHVGELLESTLAYSVLLLGIWAVIWPAAKGMSIRRLPRSLILLLLVLPYQVMVSAAALTGLLDLIRRPYHWHKTPH